MLPERAADAAADRGGLDEEQADLGLVATIAGVERVEAERRLLLDQHHHAAGGSGLGTDCEFVAARLQERAVVAPVGFGAQGQSREAAALRGLRQRSEEHTSELQSLMRISYAVFCLKKKKSYNNNK